MSGGSKTAELQNGEDELQRLAMGDAEEEEKGRAQRRRMFLQQPGLPSDGGSSDDESREKKKTTARARAGTVLMSETTAQQAPALQTMASPAAAVTTFVDDGMQVSFSGDDSGTAPGTPALPLEPAQPNYRAHDTARRACVEAEQQPEAEPVPQDAAATTAAARSTPRGQDVRDMVRGLLLITQC